MLIDITAARKARAAQRAAQREGRGDAIDIDVDGQHFTLPAELPATVLDRLLDPEVEIAQLIIVTLRSWRQGSAADNALELIATILTERPDLPLGFVRAVKDALADLFGPEQWQRFQDLQPSTEDLLMIIGALVKAYGGGLADFFSSSAPSTSGGTTSSATSNASTDSTPAASGNDQVSQDTSASVA